jgi:predicted TIM-barrel fold metal-dependent hydrolase
MAIDLHGHWWPEELAEALRARTTPPRVETAEDGRTILRITRGALRLARDHADLGARIAIMDAHGVAWAVLSNPGPGIDNLPVEEAAPLCRLYNDGAAAACRRHPGRFAAFATLPCEDMEAAIEELDRAMRFPGIVGALLPSNGFFTLADAERYRPLFEVAARHRAHMFVHPSPLPEAKSAVPGDNLDNSLFRRTTLDNQAQISRTMVTLCLTDFLDDFPDVTVQVPNLGGNIPLEVERMDHISLNRTPAAEPPSKRLRRCYVDCNSYGPRGIELAVAVYGADRVVLGTDGTEFGTAWSLRALDDARIDDQARRAVSAANAETLLGARIAGVRRLAVA